MPRSGLARSGTEDGFHMKKYMIPAALIGDHEVAGSFLVAYYLTGRFGLYKEYAKYAEPSPVAEHEDASSEAPAVRQTALLQTVSGTGGTTVGTPAEWTQYREQFARILSSERAKALAPSGGRAVPRLVCEGRVVG